MMKKNMGAADRMIRSAVVIIIAVLLLTGQIGGVFGTIAGILAIIFLVTSLLSFCPLYLPFGISTAKKSTPGEK
jgi:hypothetical protein